MWLELIFRSIMNVLPWVGSKYLAEDFQQVFEELSKHSLFPFVILFCIIFGVVKDWTKSILLTLAYILVRWWYLSRKTKVTDDSQQEG